MRRIRQQLSLFVAEQQRSIVESVRAVLDPVQHQLIPAHVTLCREDELHDLSVIRDRLLTLHFPPFELRFGKPELFYEHGILLPCIEGEAVFYQLRKLVLNSNTIREQKPHMTLAHPRNPKATGNSLKNAEPLKNGVVLIFSDICLIEQRGDEPWQILEIFSLSN